MKMGSAVKSLARWVGRLNIFVYRLTGGAVGGRIGKAPVLLLTTTGRKSGRSFTNPLLYLRDGSNLVVVASFGGSDDDPLWWRNLQANPQAKVEIGHDQISVVAESASPEEKARLWPLLVDVYADYAAYQKRTRRDIPLAILRPVKP